MMADHDHNEKSQSSQSGVPHLFRTPPLDLRLQPPSSTHQDGDKAESGGGAVSGGRRPRGRPPGSKNKPKSSAVVMRESPLALHSHVFEISTGADVVKSLVDYTRRHKRGICVLSGNGMVSHVTLHQLGTPAGTVVTLHGRFHILSISGSMLPRQVPPGMGGLSVYLSGGQGQVVGGIIAAPLVAWGPVFLTVGSFSEAEYEKLPLASEDQQQLPSSTSHSPGVSTAGHVAGDGGGAPFFRCENIQFFSASSSSAVVPDGNLFGLGATNTTGAAEAPKSHPF